MNNYSSNPASSRKSTILKVVREGGVMSQEVLRARLKELGIDVAQATLSRDIKELGLVKGPAGYLAPNAGSLAPDGVLSGNTVADPQVPNAAEKLDRALRESVLFIETAGTFVVIKTPPAEANTVARLIDQCGVDGSVGTIAGDDTIFLAAKTQADAESVRVALLGRVGLNTGTTSKMSR